VLNHATRYFPILKVLKEYLPPNGNLVEIGSGMIGVGEFWSRPFVGCDLSFARPPKAPLQPVICSADALPFHDRSFDALIASDVMEHIPPTQRGRVVSEIFRVTRTVAVIGYPCGQGAWALDRRLHEHYRSRGLPPPPWLEEHLLNPFPDEALFVDVPAGWEMKVIRNESLRFHLWMMRAEMHRTWARAFRLALLIAPGLVRRLLPMANREPYYRMIFVFTRRQ